MSGFKCYNCGKRFEYPKVVQEMLGYYGNAPYYEPFAYCPHCNSDEFEEWEEDKVKTMDGYSARVGELLYNPVTDSLYLIESIDEEYVEISDVMCDDEGEALKADDGSYVCGDSREVTRELIEETMEGM